MRHCRPGGFTLIEVLLVVVIMAVLAGTILPHFLGSTDDAKQSMLKHNMNIIEVQIEIYRTQHQNQYPTLQDGGLPQLISATSAAGEIGPAGTSYPFGPYILEAPMNPYDGSKNVEAVASPGQKPTDVVSSLGGWQYDETTGAFWPNNPEYYQ
jgi:general secretion pathway protein G